MTTVDPDDLIPITDLPPALLQYLRRAEREVGVVSRKVLRERQLSHEGRVVQRARQDGVPLYVAERGGQKIATTAATAELDTAVRTR
jgi:hypothetical protein